MICKLAHYSVGKHSIMYIEATTTQIKRETQSQWFVWYTFLGFFSKMLKLNDTLHTWVSNNILSIKSTNLIKHINLICSIYVIYHFADQYKTKN